MNFEGLLRRFNPTLPKEWLLVLAGVMWSGVGLMLFGYAYSWLTHPLSRITLLLGSLGLIISIWANRIQFSKLAKKNIERILALNDRACIFSFQAWTGYVIIAIMIATGIVLKNSAIPKPYLAVVYIGIGGALLQASTNYYVRFFRVARAQASITDR